MLRFLNYFLVSLILVCSNSFAQVNPDPQYHWIFDKSHSEGYQFVDQQGNLDARHLSKPSYLIEAGSEYLELNGSSDVLELSDNIKKIRLPERDITVEAVVRIREHGSDLGIIGAFQDNGDFERGWVMGLNGDKFYFCVAADAKKRMTYLHSSKKTEAGKWYHVTGTYNGTEMKLYINGEQTAFSTDQKGNIAYPEKAWFMIGAYRDDNEFNPVAGSLREIKVYENVLTDQIIKTNFEKVKELTELPVQTEPPSDIIAGPYLQYATKNSIKILWETKTKTNSRVDFGEEVPLKKSKFEKDYKNLHEIELSPLATQAEYFYRVVSETKNGEQSVSKVYSFQTAVKDETAFAFGIVSDTQHNVDVWGRVSTLIFNERPHFVVHAGDIVSTGNQTHQWLDEFLAPSRDLMSRVPIYTILGNHEGDADNYYKYMANPEPEHHYTFTYGNAQFFMIDTNRKVKQGSDQYKWLEEELKKSQALWKFAVHHHPPYSSDENDYGDAWREKSERGDKRLQPLIELYEKYGLDICFFGHIHDYERTWPIKENKVNPDDGVIYVQAGGGGGGLENYAPTRSWFTRKVHRDHHFLIANIYNNICEIQAIDHNGLLFDQFSLKK